MMILYRFLLGVFLLIPCVILAQQQKLKMDQPLQKVLPDVYLIKINQKYGLIDGKGRLVAPIK